MPLTIGDEKATTGMAGAIYQAMEQHLPIKDEDKLAEDTITSLQESRHKISFVMAIGIITHLLRDPATEPEYATVLSSSAEDAAFWGWFVGFVNAFKTWASNPSGDITMLRTALKNFLDANPTPNQL